VTGMHNVKHATSYGTVVYDWSNAKQIWANGTYQHPHRPGGRPLTPLRCLPPSAPAPLPSLSAAVMLAVWLTCVVVAGAGSLSAPHELGGAHHQAGGDGAGCWCVSQCAPSQSNAPRAACLYPRIVRHAVHGGADPGVEGYNPRVWAYRNTIKALNWYSSVRKKLDDPV
jgi:hypothetical protein